MTARDRAVTELADLVKQAAHSGGTHTLPTDDYIRGEAAGVVDTILAAADERTAERPAMTEPSPTPDTALRPRLERVVRQLLRERFASEALQAQAVVAAVFDEMRTAADERSGQ